MHGFIGRACHAVANAPAAASSSGALRMLAMAPGPVLNLDLSARSALRSVRTMPDAGAAPRRALLFAASGVIIAVALFFARRWRVRSSSRPELIGDEPAEIRQLRAELTPMKLSVLKKKAREAGVPEETLDEADDAEDPKLMLVQTLVETRRSMESAASRLEEAELDMLRDDLRSAKLSVLKKRALAGGAVDQTAIDELDDADNPKETLVAIMVDAKRAAMQAAALHTPRGDAEGTEEAAAALAAELAELLAELTPMKLSVLKKKARAAGVPEARLDEADDADDPKTVLVETLVEIRRTESAAAGAAGQAADPAAAAAAAAAELAKLREELVSTKLSVLKKQVRQAGAAEDTLADIDDAEDSKEEAIRFLLDAHRSTLSSGAAAAAAAAAAADDAARQQKEEEASLRAELARLKLSELRKRAVRIGVREEELDAADDSDDVKSALIESVARLQSGAAKHAGIDKGVRPHYGGTSDTKFSTGSSSKNSPDTLPGNQGNLAGAPDAEAASRQHVMLSYQWDCQKEVMQVRERLTQKGISCWMDVDNGMQSNIYDSMAAGVSGAMAVVAFMNAAYEASENCRLELQFAKQTCRPIIPCIMTRGYAASGWLGIVTAGLLWVPLFQNLNGGIEQLATQIRIHETTAAAEVATDDGGGGGGGGGGGAAAGAEGGGANTDAASGQLFTMTEMRGELMRLQAELDTAAAPRAAAERPSAGGACRLPAGVPDLPPGLQISTEMKELLETLVVEALASGAGGDIRVGFWGQGGVGKTTISAWLVRQPPVRGRFSHIGWCPLGQSPNIERLQEMLHLQLTGEELDSEASTEQRQEKLTQAMAGKNLLLVLDDLWQPEHARALNWLDETTGSKVLMSSRVRSVLEGAHIVCVSVPTEAEAVDMLLSTAGVSSTGRSPPPPEAYEVVEFCNRLPLAIGIAGKLCKDMAIQDDWSGVLAMMKEEFDAAQSVEETVIATSVRGITGPQRANILTLFKCFALLREDCECPPEVLQMLFEALAASEQASAYDELVDSKKPSPLQLRRWLKILHDRSLVIGHIEKPMLHDLVADYVAQSIDPERLRRAHRELIGIFRRRRPDGGWRPSLATFDRVSKYVNAEVQHHVRAAW
eukprot:SAG22_NODE_115_length_19315_cov_10.458368_5_plen_1113_part_00